MSEESKAYTIAKLVIDSVDNGRGLDEVREYVVENAEFDCQADALEDIKTIKDYAKWMVL